MKKQNDALINIQRVLNQMDKAMDRLSRLNFYSHNQKDFFFDQIEMMIERMRSWIQNHRIFAGVNSFFISLSILIKEISELIRMLYQTTRPAKGKKEIKKSRKEKQRRAIFNSVDSMLEHIAELIEESKPANKDTAIQMEKAVLNAFTEYCGMEIEKSNRSEPSKRGDKTYVFPWSDPKGYEELERDKKRFKALINEFFKDGPQTTGHKPFCQDSSKYALCGFRAKPRRAFTAHGKKNFEFGWLNVQAADKDFPSSQVFCPERSIIAST